MTDEYLNRQRRNLVLMSSLVLFLNLTGAKLNTINFFGNTININNPDSIPLLTTIVLIYFLVRYSQFLHDKKEKGFKTRFFRRVEHNLESYVLKREYKNEESDLKYQYPNIDDVEYTEHLSMFNDAMPPNTAAASFCGKEGGAVMDLNEIPISNKELIFPYIKTTLYIIFRTHLVTEYIFPYLLCIAALLSYSSTVLCLINIRP